MLFTEQIEKFQRSETNGVILGLFCKIDIYAVIREN